MMSLCRSNHHETAWIFALGACDDGVVLTQRVVHGLSIRGRHWLQCPFFARLDDFLGDLLSKSTKRGDTTLTILSDIDENFGPFESGSWTARPYV